MFCRTVGFEHFKIPENEALRRSSVCWEIKALPCEQCGCDTGKNKSKVQNSAVGMIISYYLWTWKSSTDRGERYEDLFSYNITFLNLVYILAK